MRSRRARYQSYAYGLVGTPRMKAPPFEYACPDTLAEAIRLLGLYNGDAKLIAGGQSLLPILAFRLAAPALLVDVRKLPGLDKIEIDDNGVSLGARVRWSDIEAERRLTQSHPLLQAAVGHVAHYQIRNRGTIGGSLAHADPSAELLGVAMTCDAEIKIVGPSGIRTVIARDFVLDALSTCLEVDEIVVSLHLPPWPPGRRWAFEEFARRTGDFALAGIALYYEEDAEGRARDPHVGVIGACRHAHRLGRAEAVLEGKTVTEQTAALVAKTAADTVEPPDDIHASAEYRRALVEALVERGLLKARARASKQTEAKVHAGHL